ncbi:hypothetical protein CAPTEDRAFT_192884 [Capitella teleta]|uniref:Xylose isomerase-like TIM barrel domain-containing protein n=1 Tax=Capitella teleta TaxID=283909 RepID=R7U556_CAPTE|nr:hypothetical protein CAPTEDRAFT_192884 [Capitella teleta]|eukprot:ELT98285.1 hypothetical protein CAPTEDRAFT_192884 [Capitella teleta]
MALNFAANLTFMFTSETDNLVERYSLAKQAGFRAVECAYPYDYPVEDLVQAKESHNLQQVLMNTWPGGADVGGYGIGALPGCEELFREKLEISVKYAKALKCPRMRIMASKQSSRFTPEEMEELDVFHLQQMEGNLTRSFEKYMPFVEHVQIAQVPHRNEPDSPGEIDYKYVFGLLEKSGYTNWIGCEYKASNGTLDGLNDLEEKKPNI